MPKWDMNDTVGSLENTCDFLDLAEKSTKKIKRYIRNKYTYLSKGVKSTEVENYYDGPIDGVVTLKNGQKGQFYLITEIPGYTATLVMFAPRFYLVTVNNKTVGYIDESVFSKRKNK